jgi:hypothetical protein
MRIPFEFALPMPLQIVIDDVGWWCGEDGHERQEPYRTGIARDHVPADYAAIISLGRQLGMKPQAAFILGEWDINNRLRQLPHSTWMGENWNNARWVGPWLDEAAGILQDGGAHMELTLHGLCHEFWEGDTFTRAEWHSREGVMRPAAEVRAHIEMFHRLLEDHAGLGAPPSSFVPCAFLHRFGGEENLASILREYGIDFMSMPFSSMHGHENVIYPFFDFDHGVMTVDRGKDLFNWFVIDPQFSDKMEIAGPICGMHWPNILHPDPARNEEVVARWVVHLRFYENRLDRMLAADVKAFRTQLAHHVRTQTRQDGNKIELDFSDFDRLPAAPHFFRTEFTFKVKSAEPLQFHSVELELLSVQSEVVKKSFLYTLRMQRPSNASRATLFIEGAR